MNTLRYIDLHNNYYGSYTAYFVHNDQKKEIFKIYHNQNQAINEIKQTVREHNKLALEWGEIGISFRDYTEKS